MPLYINNLKSKFILLLETFPSCLVDLYNTRIKQMEISRTKLVWNKMKCVNFDKRALKIWKHSGLSPEKPMQPTFSHTNGPVEYAWQYNYLHACF